MGYGAAPHVDAKGGVAAAAITLALAGPACPGACLPLPLLAAEEQQGRAVWPVLPARRP